MNSKFASPLCPYFVDPVGKWGICTGEIKTRNLVVNFYFFTLTLLSFLYHGGYSSICMVSHRTFLPTTKLIFRIIKEKKIWCFVQVSYKDPRF